MDILQKSKNNQRRIGLTGGIASGKTTITNYIRKHKNIPILDADNLSRELIKPNTYGYKKILDYFGNKIIDNKSNSEREINRKLLRNIIFKHSASKEWIEKLLHPLIKERMIEECRKLRNNQTIVLVIPLLLFYWMNNRWNIMGKFERLGIYGLVFLFFPGLILFSPFLNLRLKGNGKG